MSSPAALHRDAVPDALSVLNSVFGLPAFHAAHVQWLAHQYQGDVFIGDELHQTSEILAGVRALKGFQALGRDTQLIADR